LRITAPKPDRSRHATTHLILRAQLSTALVSSSLKLGGDFVDIIRLGVNRQPFDLDNISDHHFRVLRRGFGSGKEANVGQDKRRFVNASNGRGDSVAPRAKNFAHQSRRHLRTKEWKGRTIMPKGDKSSYTSKQKRKAEHIEQGYKKRGISAKTAKARAWATVNKESSGGKKSGSGRGKKENKSASKKGGRKGGRAKSKK
jgi:hypothetical protein